MERPDGMTAPEGMEKPEGTEFPEGMEKPEGMERPEGGNGGFSDFGDMGSSEVSTEFVIADGGSYFSNVTVAE